MKHSFAYLLFIVVISLTSTAQAKWFKAKSVNCSGDKAVLYFQKQHLSGQHDLGVAASLFEACGNKIANRQIETIAFLAKSKHGQGQATLCLQGACGMKQIIFGKAPYFNDRKETYERWTYWSAFNSKDPNIRKAYRNSKKISNSQIKLRGNFIVSRIVIVFRKKPNGQNAYF